MTVQELIEKLQEIEDKSKICMLNDPEGTLVNEITWIGEWECVVEIR
jgi:hypothetical protein